jgi:xylulokinase
VSDARGAGAVTLGIDIGTTSVKAVAADEAGNVVARARVPHQVHSRVAGEFEHDVDEAWRDGVVAALTQVGNGLDVAAVNVSAMVPSLGAVDADGRGVGPGLLYGDHRGERDDADPTQPGDSGELLAFLAWHAAHSPDAAGYWPAQAVANHALTGRGAIDSTTAMTAYPLFDFVGWDEALAGAAGTTPARLPNIVSGVEPAGEIRDGLVAAGALVGGGTIDAMGEQIVAGADAAGDVLVICGATLITWGVIDDWVEVPGLWTIPHTAAGLTMVGGPSNAGGLFVDRVRRWLGDPNPDAVAAADPADLPVWLPYVRGERVPLHRRDIRASVQELSLHHGPEHVMAAALESSAFVARHLIDLGREAGLAPRRIVATGGGTNAGAWMQALADATQLPVEIVAVPEGAALGSAFIARCVAGLEENMTDARRWAKTSHTVEPRLTAAGPVQDRYERFRALTAALS